jgi:flagella basal body P-ring formation protein FlgA
MPLRQNLPPAGQVFVSPAGGLGQNEAMLLRRTLLLLLLASRVSWAADSAIVLDIAEQFARTQSQGLPGQVAVTMGKIDVSRLPACTAHEAYFPPGTRLRGRTYIGVRCLAPSSWSVLVPAQITVTGQYVTTARPLLAGQTVQEGDLATATGDLANLPSGVLTDPGAALGKTLRNSLGAGQPLRNDQLQAPLVIRQGQSVRVISRGTGFAVSGEGKAISNAAEGQVAQVRMASGQTVSGIAQADGSVEIGF